MRIVACAVFEPPLTYEFMIASGIPDQRDLLTEIFRWADGRRAVAVNKTDIALAYRARGDNTLSTSALASDTVRIEALLQHGYALHAGKSYRNARMLGDDLPPVALPDGAQFHAVAEYDIEGRAELHRDAWSVWGPSQFSAERYRKLRASTLYDPDLDIVLTHEGRMVSYCICWLDDANKIGLFEPVGTRPSVARRGFGRLVLYEAFRRLRERGMMTAIVGTGDVNQPAVALYASAGFKVVEEIHTYVKADAIG
jgi:ribosomal protein S18 acetylase RimI-like enzyme